MHLYVFCEIDELWKEKLKNKRDGATYQSCFAGGETWWQKLANLGHQSNSLLFHFVFQWSIKLLYWPKQNVPWKNPFKMRYSLLKSVPYFKSQKIKKFEGWISQKTAFLKAKADIYEIGAKMSLTHHQTCELGGR